MSYSIARKGQTYPVTPKGIIANPLSFAPVYATTNANGAIGNGSFVGTWEMIGNVMRLKLALVFGGTTATGTGEVLLPLPTGWTAAMIDTANMPGTFPFTAEQWAGATKNATTALGVSLLVSTFGGNTAIIKGLVAAMAGAAPNDVFQISVDVPFARFP